MVLQRADQLDARILDALQRNGRVAQVEIAREVGLAPSAVLERMRKLLAHLDNRFRELYVVPMGAAIWSTASGRRPESAPN